MLIPYKFKSAGSALYSTDGTLEIIEHKKDSCSTQASKVNIGNGVLWICSARSHFKPVKVPLSSCTSGVNALRAHLETK